MTLPSPTPSITRDRPASAAWALVRDGVHGAPSPVDSGLLTRQNDFAAVLAKKTPTRGLARSPQEEARNAAEDFVSVALVQPILKRLREGQQAAPPFAPGPAEKQFRGLMDGVYSRRIVKASSFPLVDRLARDMLKHGGPAARPPVDRPLPEPTPELRLNVSSR